MKKGELIIIGTTDFLDLPDFDIKDLGCKIDTGAETSALHCHRVHLIEKNGEEWVEFKLLDKKHPEYKNRWLKKRLHKTREIKNSFGNTETRFTIKSKVVLFNRSFTIEFSLADREKMKFPILIGKGFLKNKFLVDVSQKNLSYSTKNSLEE